MGKGEAIETESVVRGDQDGTKRTQFHASLRYGAWVAVLLAALVTVAWWYATPPGEARVSTEEQKYAEWCEQRGLMYWSRRWGELPGVTMKETDEDVVGWCTNLMLGVKLVDLSETQQPLQEALSEVWEVL